MCTFFFSSVRKEQEGGKGEKKERGKKERKKEKERWRRKEEEEERKWIPAESINTLQGVLLENLGSFFFPP